MFSFLLLVLILEGALTVSLGIATYEDVSFSSSFCQSLASDNAELRLGCDFQGLPAKLSYLGEPGKRFTKTQSFHLSVKNASSLWITPEFQTSWRKRRSLRFTLEHIGKVNQDAVKDNTIDQIKLLDVKVKASSMDSLLPGLLSHTEVLLLEMEDCHVGLVATNAFSSVGKSHQLRIYRSRIDQWQEKATPTPITLSESDEPVSLLPFLLGNSSIQVMEPDALHLVVEKDAFFNIVNSSLAALKTGALRLAGSGHVIITDSTFRNLDPGGIQVNMEPPTPGQLKLIEKPSFTAIGSSIQTDQPMREFFNGIRVEQGNRYLKRITLSATRFDDLAHLSNLWTDHSVTLQDIGVICSCGDLQNFTTPEVDEEVTSPSTGQDADYDYQLDGQDSLIPQRSLDQFVRCLQPSEPSHLLNFSTYNRLYCEGRSTTVSPVDSSSGIEDDIAVEEAATAGLIVDHWLFYLLASAGAAGVAVLILLGIIHVIRRRRTATLNPDRKPEDHVMTPVRATNQYQSAVGVVSEQPICDEDREEDC